MVIRERLYTADDLWVLSHSPEYAATRLELSEGRLIEMAPAGWEHGEFTFDIGLVVGGFIRHNKLGSVTTAETGYILFRNPDGKDIVRAPDLGFVRAERLPKEGVTKGYVPFAPDLAIEVVSPGDSAADIEQKVLEYLKYGTRLVWVFYPDSQTVLQHTPDGTKRYSRDDTLDGGEVLPGFKLNLATLFPAR